MKTKQIFWGLVAAVAALGLTACDKEEDPKGGLALNKTSYEMYVGEEYTLKATVDGAAVVEFAQEGTYTVSVYNAAGVAVAAETESVQAGATMHIALGAKGTYIVRVEKDGKVVRTVKLLNK